MTSCAVCFYVQPSDTKEEKDGENDNKATNDSNGENKKGSGTQAKKKKHPVKTVELTVDTSVPGFTRAQLQEAIEKEVHFFMFRFIHGSIL